MQSVIKQLVHSLGWHCRAGARAGTLQMLPAKPLPNFSGNDLSSSHHSWVLGCRGAHSGAGAGDRWMQMCLFI